MYKKAIRSAQNNFDIKINSELRNLKINQPQAYWTIINSANGLSNEKNNN